MAAAAFALQELVGDSSFDPSKMVLEVEPPASVDAEDPEDDIIDFAIRLEGTDGVRVQVKSSRTPRTRTLGPAEARRVFDRLDAEDGLGESILLTNRSLAPSLASECDPPRIVPFGHEVIWSETNMVSGHRVERRIIIAHDLDRLETYFEELVRKLRRDNDRGSGVVSSRLVGVLLRHLIFDAAAGHRDSRISGAELRSFVVMPDARIAHAAGAFDWGNPHSRVPNVRSSVPRLDLLDNIGGDLEVSDRTPPVAILTGHTGIGKSVIASDYCHLNHNRYEMVLWLDAGDEGLLEAQVRDYAEQVTGSVVRTGSDSTAVLSTALGAHRGPWLVVFDGAPGRREIERYVPTVGHGSVLITSTNSTGWWPTGRVHEIAPFDSAQALRCFAAYAEIDDSDIPSVAGTHRVHREAPSHRSRWIETSCCQRPERCPRW